MEYLQKAWDAAWAASTPPALWVTILLLAGGTTPIFIPQLWRHVRHIVTLAHESGHAIVGVLTGRKLNGIKLHTDTSGVTTTSGVGWGLSGLLTTLAGYPAPAAVAGAILLGVLSGHAGATIAVLLAILAVLTVFTRNMWGLLVTGLTTVAFAILLVAAPIWITQGALLLLAGLLAAGSFRTLIEERRSRKSGVEGSDIAALAHNTSIPATAWWVLALILSAGWIAMPIWLLAR